jgi:hypothetical protein
MIDISLRCFTIQCGVEFEGLSEMDTKEKEIPEISVENSREVHEQGKSESPGVEPEKVHLIYKPPRLFRKSLIYKTMKLFGSNSEEKRRQNRPLREK